MADDGLKTCSRKSPTEFYEGTFSRTDVYHRRQEILFDDEGVIFAIFFFFAGGGRGLIFDLEVSYRVLFFQFGFNK